MDSNVGTIIFIFMYFVPTGLAPRGRRSSVFAVNLFLGWTMIGWVVALFLALRARENGKVGA